jgi:energy-converting hydrogenase Eha subunit F
MVEVVTLEQMTHIARKLNSITKTPNTISTLFIKPLRLAILFGLAITLLHFLYVTKELTTTKHHNATNIHNIYSSYRRGYIRLSLPLYDRGGYKK